jgi:hypothetical protein
MNRDDRQVSPETRGVAIEVMATVDRSREIEGMAGHLLRMRTVTIAPGGVFGPVPAVEISVDIVRQE